MPGLSTDQIEHYREHGWVTVPGVLTDDEIERYRARAREIALGDLPDDATNRRVIDIAFAKGLRPMPDDPEHAIWKIMNPDRFDATFREFMRTPAVLDAVESLLGPDLLAFLLMFIYKPPRLESSVHPFHQDALYFPFEPQSLCCGVWIPLDDVDADNGTLEIVPGSHRRELIAHEVREGINFGALAATEVEGNEEEHAHSIPIEMPAGDCLLFDTHMLHRSGGNRTDRHRRVLTLHMASAKCRPTGAQFNEFGFTSVRGQTYDGCLQPVAQPSLRLHHEMRNP